MNKKLSFLLAVLLFALLFVGCKKTDEKTAETKNEAAETKTEAATISGEELNKIEEDNKEKENYLVIDVRDAEEYLAGHVKHAINIPVAEIEADPAKALAPIEGWKDKKVVTICNTGKKSAKAQELMLANGFKTVLNAAGVKDFSYDTITKAKTVMGAEFQELVKKGDATILDMREEKDYNEARIPGAINTTADTVEQILDQIPKDKPVLTYCYTGNRSFAVAHKLAELGYDVTNAWDGTKEFEYEMEK
ncbi:MAG: rhodanese-like domain-containing protein [Ezakiella sp.]|nr:rhodanese-like domain-containing protein [Ezakiella sp.]